MQSFTRALRGRPARIGGLLPSFKQPLLRRFGATATQQAAPAVEAAEQQHEVTFKANLDFKSLAAQVDLYETNCRNRLSNANPRAVAQLYAEFLQLKQASAAIHPLLPANDNGLTCHVLQKYFGITYKRD